MVIFYFLFLLNLMMTIAFSKAIKRVINPVSIVTMTYSLWIMLGRMELSNQFLPSYYSSSFILINILFINCSIVVTRYNNINPIKISIFNIHTNFSRLLILFRKACFLISLILVVNLIYLVINGSLDITKIRDVSYTLNSDENNYKLIYFNSTLYYIFQYLIRGFVFFDVSYSMLLMINKKKKIKTITLLNFCLWAIIMMSRIEIMKIAIFIILMVALSNNKAYGNNSCIQSKQKIQYKKILFVSAASFVILFIRSLNKELNVFLNSISSFLIDFSGSNYMFSMYFESFLDGYVIDDANYIFKLLGGLGWIIEILIYAVTSIRIFDHTSMNLFLSQGHYIGSSDHYNAFYTMFMPFLNSGGILGVFFFSIIIGSIIGIFWQFSARKYSLDSFYIMTVFLFTVVMGTYGFLLGNVSSFSILVYFIMFRKAFSYV